MIAHQANVVLVPFLLKQIDIAEDIQVSTRSNAKIGYKPIDSFAPVSFTIRRERSGIFCQYKVIKPDNVTLGNSSNNS